MRSYGYSQKTTSSTQRKMLVVFWEYPCGCAHFKDVSIGINCLSQSSVDTGLVAHRWLVRVDWARARRVPRGAAPGGLPKSISGGGGPSDGQRVGLLLVGVEHDGPPATSEPLPCRPPPPRRASSSPPAVEKLAKGVPVPGFTVPAPLGPRGGSGRSTSQLEGSLQPIHGI